MTIIGPIIKNMYTNQVGGKLYINIYVGISVFQ